EYKKTGGGPPPKPPSQSSEQIIEIFEDTPAFSGLGGFETGGGEGLDLPTLSSEDMMKLGLIAQVKEDHSPLPPNRKRRISQADILEEQQKALKLQQEMLELKKTKLRMEILLISKK
ncbi:unnamed protein product, partial [Porites evermanni]